MCGTDRISSRSAPFVALALLRIDAEARGGGARAASAGTYILYASHVAAMAPGTNLGAATPVQLGGLPEPEEEEKESEKDSDADAEKQPQPRGARERKLINDAAAYIRSLATMRQRNAEWAERAVREGVSLPAEEALEKGVIDVVSAELDALLVKLDGVEVQLPTGSRKLQTINLQLDTLTPDWRSQLLSIISNPNVAYILMLLGIYGLIYEFANPGSIAPGTAGAIFLFPNIPKSLPFPRTADCVVLDLPVRGLWLAGHAGAPRVAPRVPERTRSVARPGGRAS